MEHGPDAPMLLAADARPRAASRTSTAEDGILYVACVELPNGVIIEQTYPSSAQGSEVLAGLLATAAGAGTDSDEHWRAEQWNLELQGWPGHALPAQLPLRRVNALQVCRQVFGQPKLRAARAIVAEDSPSLTTAVREQMMLEHDLVQLMPSMTDFSRYRTDVDFIAYRAQRASERRSRKEPPPDELCKYTELEALPHTIPVPLLLLPCTWCR